MHSASRTASIVLAALGLAQAACALGHVERDAASAVGADDRAALYDSLAKEERMTPVVRIVQAVTPAVVFIQTEAYQQVRGFFGPEDRVVSGAGSGVVINPKGYIVTNYHVVEGARRITVSFDGDPGRYAAELVSYVREEDLALLKVLEIPESLRPAADIASPASTTTTQVEFPTVRWGTSVDLMPGEQVVAIGNPHGQTYTVSTGIISGLHRDIAVPQRGLRFHGLIQTDASINRGNSGGPLFNLRGEVIGINTAIYSPTDSGGSVGVGFSVPSNLTKSVVAQLRQYGSTRRGSLGVTVRSVDQAIAEAYGLKRPEGAIVTGLTKGGPAEGAGLKVGDLITTFNNQQIKESRDLSRIIGVAQVGAQISVRYIRGGKTLATTVKLAPLEAAKDAKTDDALGGAAEELSNLLGVGFGVIEDADRRRLTIPNSVRGVIVRNVETGSDALGKLRVGAVVTEVNFQPVTSPEQAIAAAEAASGAGKPVLLQVWGANEVSFVTVRTR